MTPDPTGNAPEARPDGVGRTIEYADMLVHPDVLAAPGAEAKCAAIFAFWDTVNAQDITAVERVQKGWPPRSTREVGCASGSRSRSTGSRTSSST